MSVQGRLYLIQGLCAAFGVVLLAAIIWAAADSTVVDGLRYLAGDRWGIVTLLDVYAGALVVAMLMWLCERRLITWIIWVLALLCLGHLVSVLYVLLLTWRRRQAFESILVSMR